VSERVLIRGGCILTLGAKTPNLPEGDVLVERGIIVDIGRGLRARDAQVIDATNGIVLPGFVDGHQHVWKTLFRNLGGGPTVDAREMAETFGRHYSPDDLYAATLLGLLCALEAGTTTLVDWCDLHIDESYTQAAIQAHIDAGLRTVLVHATPAWVRDESDPAVDLRRFTDARSTLGPLTTTAYGAGSRGLSDLEQAAQQWAVSRGLGLRIHAHAGVSASDRGSVAAAAGAGLLGTDVTLIHGTHLGSEDVAAMTSHGTGLVLTPSSEMANGIGAPPLQELIDNGLRPGLGVDEGTVTPWDLFSEMRTAQSVQHATLFDLKLAGKAGVPKLLSTRDVIRYATLDGARAVGLAEVTGSLEVGKQADLVVLRTDRANIFPINDPIGAVVWGMDASNVDCVLVGGRPLMQDGALVADVPRARELAIAARDRLAGVAGPLVPTTVGGAA
jgi:5-methylthioadenosine/S-adenosylhomocysteine deaminase